MDVILYGYRFSVYTRIVRMTLAEKTVPYRYEEIDPFADTVPAVYLEIHPFRRVPALVHDQTAFYETAAITQYIDEGFDGRALQPKTPGERARMRQIIAVTDHYGYWPMVRQVFAHGVFRPAAGEPADDDQIREGLATAATTLGALEALTEGGPQLIGTRLSLADFHLAAMIAYFTAEPGGRKMLAAFPNLSGWWSAMRDNDRLLTSDPGLPSA